MKTIVVPTDFSSAADNAMQYAAGLAKEVNASLFLLHVYQMPIAIIDMPVMMISSAEIKENSDKGLSLAKELVLKNYPELIVESECRMGDIVEEINEICKEKNPIAIVVGTKDFSGFEKLLFGNTALSIIRNCTFPIISVPVHSKMMTPKNVVLGTDLTNIQEIPTQKIIDMIQLLQAKLHIVHIREKENDVQAAQEELLLRLSAVNPVFHSVTNENVLHGLQHYVDENNIDLLLVLPHKHNLYERLFFNLHTEGLIEKMQVPVMCVQTDC